MNCLESRRTLLADPRFRTTELDEHLASCHACHAVAEKFAKFDREIAKAARVRPPDGLADRILLVSGERPPIRQYAAAAAIAIALAVGVMAGPDVTDALTLARAVDAVGPAHPAVVAISEVTDDASRPLPSTLEASRDPEQVLKQLGLRVKKGKATAHYVGKCHLTVSNCDHIVLSTGDAQANVMLMPDESPGARLIVEDRHMTALVNPAGAGGYIVVANTPKAARRIEKLLVKG
jgi:hypothetical protein